MRVRVSSSHTATSISIAISITKERDLGNCVAVQRKQRALQGGGQAVRHGTAPPDQLHHFQNQVGQTKGDQQLRHMAILVYLAQAVALKQRPQCAHHAAVQRPVPARSR